jgi:Asp-tRNA(Asn)/Glu-tRNA(Gln) amidotransferase A subunit family amidase
MRPYQPASLRLVSYSEAAAGFRIGKDDPRAFLERCLSVIANQEPHVKAWASLNEQAARKAADASTRRWKDSKPLSAIDGMPIGIKDLIETKDLPTQMGSAAFEGNFPKRDSAVVRALREAGAVILGKTVTTELGGSHPGPTRNPFDYERTPGGSSSGSAAAVGAGMVPVAIGTQVGGSIIRPASYCANWALKPTYGAINRGERLGFSQSHMGVHAGSAVDMWVVAMEMASRAGGDPGHVGLLGDREAPTPLKPQRLIVMETAGWVSAPASSKNAFETLLERLRRVDVQILRRTDASQVDAFERSIEGAADMTRDLCGFEVRWSLENTFEQHPGKLTPGTLARLERGREMTLEAYRVRLAERDLARERLAALAPLGDVLIGLATPAPASPFTATSTGDPSFNYAGSVLGAPNVAIPHMAIDGLPLGIQLLGQPHSDAGVVAIARWLSENIEPVVWNGPQ